jgi:hypothetical protein
MTNLEPKQKMTGPWRNLHAAVWLIGLAILAWRGWWWPGILILVGLSMILEVLLKRYAPQAFELEEPSMPSPQATTPPVTSSPGVSSPVVPIPGHSVDLLPTSCPKCGGPIRGHEVKWNGPRSAECPYCGGNLPMGKS